MTELQRNPLQNKGHMELEVREISSNCRSDFKPAGLFLPERRCLNTKMHILQLMSIPVTGFKYKLCKQLWQKEAPRLYWDASYSPNFAVWQEK